MKDLICDLLGMLGVCVVIGAMLAYSPEIEAVIRLLKAGAP